MAILTFQIPGQQHQEWFIVKLLPHILRPLIQQKVTSQSEALKKCNETRGIFGRRYWRNGKSSDAVGCIDNSSSRAYQREGEMRTILVHQVQDGGPSQGRIPIICAVFGSWSTKSITKWDTVRYVTNGAITPLSFHCYRSIRVHQITFFSTFASR
jgi:hypothetical protein